MVCGACWLKAEGTEKAVRLDAGECCCRAGGTSSSPAALMLRHVLQARCSTPTAAATSSQSMAAGPCYLVGSRFEVSGRHAALLLRSLPPLIRIRAPAANHGCGASSR
ncbi:cupin domain-containing protein [Xaviernesmea oryzae]|uniref:cupin domain-containing protein n=1 Tax=Xaviernesmea oryzae TaxID=464029 RepID=UPI000A19563B